jgi:chorismate synthase
MNPNTFGNRFCVTTFGESHGIGVGCVIDGCPAGVFFDPSILKANLDRRRPGSSDLVTSRKEEEIPEILSGIFNGKTLGTPIAIIVRNTDQRSDDYAKIKTSPRTGHADDVWKIKFGLSDHRGGGRSSGRETLSRVLAGSLAQMLMHKVASKTKVFGWIESIGPCSSDQKVIDGILKSKLKLKAAETENFRFFGSQKNEVLNLLKSAKESGESYGAVLKIVISNPPKSLGEPVFRKFKSDLAMAMMSVGAASGFDFGAGIDSVDLPGTLFHQIGPKKSKSSQEQYGGIRGGITTGEDITFRIFVKPTSSILDIAKKGRHDPCIGIRALAVFEAMTYLVLADQYLMMKTNRSDQF